MADLPATQRRILRKRPILDAFSMNEVAAQSSIHQRTLDRRLQRHGTTCGQRVAESVSFSSAAHFATAFRRRAS